MWIEFQDKMSPFRVFSVQDVKKQFPSMNLMNLVRWQEKGYILKLRNRWYAFNNAKSSENMVWLAGNLIYSPSYISLHTALSTITTTTVTPPLLQSPLHLYWYIFGISANILLYDLV